MDVLNTRTPVTDVNPPATEPAEDAAALRAQLQKISAENQQLRNQWSEKSRQYDQTVGRLGQQLDQLNKRLTEATPPPAPRAARKIPNPISENFEVEMEGYLADQRAQMERQIQEQGARLDKFGAAISNLGFGIAVKGEQDELRTRYGLSDAEIEEAMRHGSERNYGSVFAAAAELPHLREKMFSRPAPNPGNGGNTRIVTGSSDLANEFSRQITSNPPVTSANQKPVVQGYQEKLAEFNRLTQSNALWELPEAERRNWMQWATGVAAGQIPMQ